MVRISVDLDGELYREFDEACKKKHRKKVEVIRELLEKWLKK